MSSHILIVNLLPNHASGLAQLQKDCFPTLGESELMAEEHFLSHYGIFPQGDFVALDDERIIGLGAGFFINFNFENPNHTFSEIIANGFHTNHDPDGEYYYGADISVHPDYRGQGIGRRLYEKRKDLVRKFNRKGIIAGGLLPNYPDYRNELSVPAYVEQVIAGNLYDGTLTMQLRNGFKVINLLENYIQDSASDNWATLILWENPDYESDR